MRLSSFTDDAVTAGLPAHPRPVGTETDSADRLPDVFIAACCRVAHTGFRTSNTPWAGTRPAIR
jgi:hypothetical protein